MFFKTGFWLFGLMILIFHAAESRHKHHKDRQNFEPVNPDLDDAPANSEVSDRLRMLVEKLEKRLRSIIRKGNPKLRIPQLDPLVIHQQALNWNTNISHLTGLIRNTKVHGLSSFRLESLKSNLESGSIQAAIEIPRVVFEGEYDIQGKVVGFVNVKGQGPFTVTIDEIVLRGNGVLRSEGNQRFLESLKFDIDFGNLESNIQNLQGGGSAGFLLNSLIAQNARAVFTSLKPQLLKQLEITMKNRINYRLQQLYAKGN